jgi:hypothetical protein
VVIKSFLTILNSDEEFGLSRVVIGHQLNIEIQRNHVISGHLGCEGISGWDV